MEARPVIPMYFREWLSEDRNLLIMFEARSIRG